MFNIFTRINGYAAQLVGRASSIERNSAAFVRVPSSHVKYSGPRCGGLGRVNFLKAPRPIIHERHGGPETL